MYFVSFLCFLLVAGVQAQVLFNSSYNCTQGCSILNPAIYIGNTLPSPTQDVTFNVTAGPNEVLFVPPNSIFNVTSLFVNYVGPQYTFVQFVIGDKSTVTVQELVGNGVLLEVNATATLVVQQSSHFENGLFLADGMANIGDAKFINSEIFFLSTMVFKNFESENGQIDILSPEFTCPTFVLKSSRCTFYYTPDLGQATFENTSATFSYGLNVDQCILSSSNVSFIDGTLFDSPNVTLVLLGKNNIDVDTISLHSGQVRSSNTSFTTFQTAHGSLAGDLSLQGELVIKDYGSISLNGNIAFSGGLTAKTYDTQITSSGTLTFGGPISLLGKSGYNDYGRNLFSVNNSILSAPSIKVVSFLVNLSNGSILVEDDLSNSGGLYIYESNSVVVGNYSQLATGTFAALNLGNSDNRPTNLVVRGTAHLDGALQYSTVDRKSPVKATIIQAQQIQGNFSTSKFKGLYSDLNLTATLNVSANSVRLSIAPKKGTAANFGVQWWVWFLVGACVFSL